MHATATTPADLLEPSSLDSPTLARRSAQLAGDERAVQVEFLLHLEVFDRRRAWAEAGYPSLWSWCQQVLHLREGAAWRRIAAMRVLRRFPQLADQLRTGRLCLTTAALLGPVLTDANVGDVVERATFLTKAEVERLVATLAPRPMPSEGLRKLPARAAPSAAAEPPAAGALASSATDLFSRRNEDRAASPDHIPAPAVAPAPSRPSVHPVGGDRYALRLNVDAAFKAELDTLRDLLAHKVPSGDLGAVLKVAVRCAVEKYGKRKGAVAPERSARKAPRVTSTPRAEEGRRAAIPAEVRREVWRRDGGSCGWRGPDGHRCGSRWQLELDHVVPVALGGPSTIANLRVTCRAHNQLAAEQVFGRETIERARSRSTGRRLSLEEASRGTTPHLCAARLAQARPDGGHS